MGTNHIGTILVELVEQNVLRDKHGNPFVTEEEAYRALSLELPIWCIKVGIAPIKVMFSAHVLGKRFSCALTQCWY